MLRRAHLFALVLSCSLAGGCGYDGGGDGSGSAGSGGTSGGGTASGGGTSGGETGGSGGSSGPIPEDDAAGALAKMICELMMEVCECSQVPFPSLQACIDASTAQLAGSFQDAMAAGLTYDAACMGEVIDWWRVTVRCRTLSELAADLQVSLAGPSCKVYSGSGAVGDGCTNYYQAFGDTCAVGLSCLNGTCSEVVVPTPKAEGEACEAGDLCEAGTLCQPPADDPQGATTCVRLPGLGEPCQAGCDLGLLCEIPDGQFEGTCEDPPGVGEPCAIGPYECDDGLYCGFDPNTLAEACLETLPAGSPCDDDDACGVGFECEDPPGSSERVCLAEEAMVCI